MFYMLYFSHDGVGLFWILLHLRPYVWGSIKIQVNVGGKNDLGTSGNVILSGEPPGKRKLGSGSNWMMGVSIGVFCHSYAAHFIIVMTSALKHWTLRGGIPPTP